MKIFILTGGFIFFALLLTIEASGQPCDNGIITDPHNPVNNQFVQMGNDFFPGNGIDTYNPWLNGFDWYFGTNTIQLFPNQVNWAHGFSNLNDVINMQHPYGGSMPTEFQYLRPNNVNPSLRDFRWEDGWELLWMNMPTAEKVARDGLETGETIRLLNIKVEELTLYILELKKEIDSIKAEIKD